MESRKRSSLLLLVTLIAATYLSSACADDLVRSEGHSGRRFLFQSTRQVQSEPKHTSFSKVAPAHSAKSSHYVNTGSNRGGAVFHPAAVKASTDKETNVEPRTAHTSYAKVVAVHHTKRTHNANTGFNRGRAVRHPGAVKVSTHKQTTVEPKTVQTSYSKVAAAHQAKSTQAVNTGFNRGRAVLHPAPTKVSTVAKQTNSEPRAAHTYYSRTFDARLKAKSDNVHRRGTVVHPDNAYTGFNRGGAVIH